MTKLIKIPGYITLSEAETRYATKRDTLKRRCQKGMVRGAIKQGKTWFVPSVPNIDPKLSIRENYPELDFDQSYETNMQLYDAEDQTKYLHFTEFKQFIFIWEYGYHFIASVISNSTLDRSYILLATHFTEVLESLRASFLLSLGGYHASAITLQRRVHENTIKALATRISPKDALVLLLNSHIQKAEHIVGVNFGSTWRLASSYTHSNTVKFGQMVKYLSGTEDEIGVSYGTQVDNKLFKICANLSVFWIYTWIKCLPIIFTNQINDRWLQRQSQSAKLMKDYLIQTGALKKDVESLDSAIDKLKMNL